VVVNAIAIASLLLDLPITNVAFKLLEFESLKPMALQRL